MFYNYRFSRTILLSKYKYIYTNKTNFCVLCLAMMASEIYCMQEAENFYEDSTTPSFNEIGT